MSSQRNNLLAGVLVTGAILGAVAAVIFLAGGLEQFGRSSYVVTFDLKTGVSGLTPGAAVQIGGKKVGTVKSVVHAMGKDGTVNGVDVTIGILKDIKLHEGATPLLQVSLLGSQGVINFASVGDGAVIVPGSRMHGTVPSFLASVGWGEEQKTQFQSILANTDKTMANAHEVTDDIKTKWPTWSARVDSITDNTDKTLAHGPKIAEDLEATLADFRKAVSSAQGVLDENRENIHETIASFRSLGTKADTFMDKLNGEIKDAAMALIDKAKSAFDKLDTGLDNINQILAEQKPTIRKTFANIRLASDQLRDTLIEVRRSPWRLLYRPDTRELNFELLYDSARSYAGAVSDLRAASESLESLVGSGADKQLLREGTVEELVTQLQQALDAYTGAEKRFMDQLMAQPDTAPDQK